MISVIYFDVVKHGPQDWRVCVSGRHEFPPFPSREMCVASARTRARLLHQDQGVATGVRIEVAPGELVSEIRYLEPDQLLELCQESLASHALRHACDLYGTSW